MTGLTNLGIYCVYPPSICLLSSILYKRFLLLGRSIIGYSLRLEQSTSEQTFIRNGVVPYLVIYVYPKDYVIIAGVGIIIDLILIALIVPLSGADGTTVVAFYIVSLLCFFTFTGLLHGAARILKIENINLLVSMFIALTSYVIFLAMLRADFLDPYLNPYRLDSRTSNVAAFEIYRKVSLVFDTIIMWILTAGIAKFMYRTEWSKAFLVSLPLLLLVVAFCWIIV